MTISMRETVASTTKIQSNFDIFPSPAHAPSPSAVLSDSDVETRRSEVVDQVRRLSLYPLESAAGNMLRVLVSIDPSVFPSRNMDYTVEMHGEEFPVLSDMTLWNAHRPPYVGSTASSAFPLKTVGLATLVGDLHPDLYEALQDLDETEDEAREEGFPIPSDTALRNARRLLYAMYRILPRRFEVYPMPDGEIAIDVPGGLGRSVLLLCGSDGGALCSVNMDGVHRRARYSDTRGLPDGFVRDALAELEQSESVAT